MPGPGPEGNKHVVRKTENRKVTYMVPGATVLPRPGEPWDPATFAELDLCLAPSRWKGMVKDV